LFLQNIEESLRWYIDEGVCQCLYLIYRLNTLCLNE